MKPNLTFIWLFILPLPTKSTVLNWSHCSQHVMCFHTFLILIAKERKKSKVLPKLTFDILPLVYDVINYSCTTLIARFLPINFNFIGRTLYKEFQTHIFVKRYFNLCIIVLNIPCGLITFLKKLICKKMVRTNFKLIWRLTSDIWPMISSLRNTDVLMVRYPRALW